MNNKNLCEDLCRGSPNAGSPESMKGCLLEPLHIKEFVKASVAAMLILTRRSIHLHLLLWNLLAMKRHSQVMVKNENAEFVTSSV